MTNSASRLPQLSTPFPVLQLEETRLFHSILNELRVWAKKHGLTPSRFEALGHIEANPLMMTQRELAAKLGVTQASTSRLVRRLVRAKLIVVLENAGDRRKHMLHLTDEGKRRLTSAKMDFAGPLPDGFLPLHLLN